MAKTKKKKPPKVPKVTSSNSFINSLIPSLRQITNNDAAILKGMVGGGDLASRFFSPGMLGRLDENVMGDPEVANILGMARRNAENDAPELAETYGIAKDEYGRARELTPLEQEMLAVARQQAKGLDPTQLTALREGGSYDAQGNFTPGDVALNRALNNTMRSVQANNLVSGIRGRAGTIAAQPAMAARMAAGADLERRLILDDFNAKNAGQQFLTKTLGSVNEGMDKRVSLALEAMGRGATALENSRMNRFNNYSNVVSNIRNDVLYRQQFNLNQIAAENAGMLGGIFGGGQFAATQQGSKQSFDLASDQLDYFKKFAERNTNNRNVWTSNPTNDPGSDSNSFEVTE